MKYLIIFCSILLTGCATVPTKQPFPEAPELLLKECGSLETIDKDQVLLSELMKTVVRNYGKYHNCANIVEEWRNWYKEQKAISDKLNK